MIRSLSPFVASVACAAAVLAADPPALSPKPAAKVGVTPGYPRLVAEQTGHLWFPKLDIQSESLPASSS